MYSLVSHAFLTSSLILCLLPMRDLLSCHMHGLVHPPVDEVMVGLNAFIVGELDITEKYVKMYGFPLRTATIANQTISSEKTPTIENIQHYVSLSNVEYTHLL